MGIVLLCERKIFLFFFWFRSVLGSLLSCSGFHLINSSIRSLAHPITTIQKKIHTHTPHNNMNSISLLITLIIINTVRKTIGDDVNRGVPESRRLSSDVKTFTCDGATLSVSKLNDDYCDCTDGTDEPGTSACSHLSSQFYCVNENHKEKFIRTSRVDDLICDCCDGSDESTGICENTCKRDAELYRIAHLEELKRFEEGAEKKKDLLERAKSKKIEIEKRIEEITETLVTLNTEIEELQSEEQRVQKEYEETKEKRHEETEARIRRGLGLTDSSHEDLLNIIFEMGQVSEQYIDIIREQAGAKKDEEISKEEEEEDEIKEEETSLHEQLSRALQEKDFDLAARVLSVNEMSEKEITNFVFRLAALNDGWAERIKRTSEEENTTEETEGEESLSSWFRRLFGSDEESDEDEENNTSLSNFIKKMLDTMKDSYQPRSVKVRPLYSFSRFTQNNHHTLVNRTYKIRFENLQRREATTRTRRKQSLRSSIL